MQWELPVSGRPMTFTADESANGKVFIRANGRMVAQPLAPGEQERVFAIDGEEFRLSRDGGVLDLQVITPEVVFETEPEAAPTTIDEGPVEHFSSWENFAVPYPPPPSVVVRARIVFAFALLALIGSLLTAVRIHMTVERMRGAENPIQFDGQIDTRGIKRANDAGEVMVSAFAWEALLAFVALMAAGCLVRGFRWAPSVLETTSWLLLIFPTFMMMRIDRVFHLQMNAAFEPVPAAKLIRLQHRAEVTAFIVAALITGGLLHLVGRRTVDRLYEEDAQY